MATLEELDEGALISILTEPKNALTKQYRRLFEMEGAELEFRDEALRAVAQRAMQRKTGARGLRTILETVLLDTMYELPSMRNVARSSSTRPSSRGTRSPTSSTVPKTLSRLAASPIHIPDRGGRALPRPTRRPSRPASLETAGSPHLPLD